IIDALVAHAKKDAEFERTLNKLAGDLLKEDADATKKKSYYRIIGFAKKNEGKYTGENPSRPLDDDHIRRLHNLLHGLGFCSKDRPSGSPAALGAWLDAALTAITPGAPTAPPEKAVPVEETAAGGWLPELPAAIR